MQVGVFGNEVEFFLYLGKWFKSYEHCVLVKKSHDSNNEVASVSEGKGGGPITISYRNLVAKGALMAYES